MCSVQENVLAKEKTINWLLLICSFNSMHMIEWNEKINKIYIKLLLLLLLTKYIKFKIINTVNIIYNTTKPGWKYQTWTNSITEFNNFPASFTI